MIQITTLMRGVKYEGGESSPDAIEIPIIISGATGVDEARARLVSEFPNYHMGLMRRGVEIRAELNSSTFKGVVRYERSNLPGIDSLTNRPESTFSFDSGGEVEHVSTSLSTVNCFGNSDFFNIAGLINYDDRGVGGVDVYTRSSAWRETHYFPPGDVDDNYRNRIDDLVCTVNSSSFRGYPAGEVLLRRVSGSRRGTRRDDLWELNFQFERRKNRKNFNVGDLVISEKKGWDYLWCYHNKDDSGFRVVRAVFVERVYEYANFNLLEI